MLDTSIPVLLLGGKENSLSVTRHLGRLGIAVRVSGHAVSWGLYSRYCKEALRVPKKKKQAQCWKRLLLSNDRRLDGHIVLAMSDEAIEFLIDNRESLLRRYILDDTDTQLQRDFLNKTRTLELAHQVGVDAPQHWEVHTEKDFIALRGKLRFPVAIKPIQSHKFTAVFHRQLFVVDDSFEEVIQKTMLAWQHGIEVFVVEMIPGPDSLLSSYYTYMTGDSRKLFQFTKSIIRRWPVNRGNACYHRTSVLPETAAAGQKFFDGVGLRGLGNIEFKRDLRDGKLKIIEVNARFTAAQELALRAGMPIDLIIYCHLTGQPPPPAVQLKTELRLWYPLRDFLGFLELRQRGELGFRGWLKSLAGPVPVLPLFSWTDPGPLFGAAIAVLHRIVPSR